ncbi:MULTISPECIES: hypothetical protein [Reinekea]|jgi:predicted small lipoprotein YifL|nr:MULTISPECIES: hypothetical protein [Reinekea]
MSIRVLLSSLLLMTTLALTGCGNRPTELTLPSAERTNMTNTDRIQP